MRSAAPEWTQSSSGSSSPESSRKKQGRKGAPAVPAERKRRPSGFGPPEIGGAPPLPRSVAIPAARATLGADREAAAFGWDTEFPRTVRDVPAFSIDVFPVTN